VNCKDDFLNTPLHYAASAKDSLEIIRFLVDHGADKSLNSFNINGLNPAHSSICRVTKDSLNNFN
jgi:ankyrin repeat protein